MRWFVEITSFGTSPAPPVTFCVEAPQWQPALQQTRALRGDTGPLGNFSIELLEEGYRAIDPVSRLRYMIQRAPDDAPLTGSEPFPPPPPVYEAPVRPVRASTLVFSSSGMAAIREEPPKPRPEPAPPAAPAAPAKPPPTQPVPLPAAIASAPAVSIAITPTPEAPEVARAESFELPPFQLIGSRDENPSERSPLTYRERVYAVAEGTPIESARDILVDRWNDLRASLDPASAGNLINLAVFDHVFRGKPRSRPLATLTWKDWKSAEPDIRYPLHETGNEPPSSREAPTRSSAPPPGSYPPVIQPAPPSAPSSAPSPRRNVSERPPPPPRVRLSGNELTLALSTAAGDLRFLRDALDGAEFVLTLLNEKLAYDIGLVSFFDGARREYVVVRKLGGPDSLLLKRMTEFAPIARAAMRNARPVVVADAAADPRAAGDERWKAAGVTLKSFVTIPVQSGGKNLGLIEIANPADGSRFNEADADGLAIVGEQLAAFLSSREMTLEPERVMKDAHRGLHR